MVSCMDQTGFSHMDPKGLGLTKKAIKTMESYLKTSFFFFNILTNQCGGRNCYKLHKHEHCASTVMKFCENRVKR